MNFIRLPSELHLLIVEKLESRELSYLSRANHHFYSLCTPVFERLAQAEKATLCPLLGHYKKLPPLVKLLLSKGHDINNLEGSSYSGTALHVAVISENYQLILIFLKSTALDLNKLDNYGDTALHIAIEWGDLDVVKLLHAAGADLEIVDRQGKTALLLALQNGHMGIMEFLVRNGANVNARFQAGTRLGITLLHGLVWPNCECERLVKLALKCGADPEARDGEHRRPIDIALEQGLMCIADILREVPLPLGVDVESDLETVWSDASSG